MVFRNLQRMMEADTSCAYSSVKCSKCSKRKNCDILRKYLGKEG